jgi:hypothetical protein
MKKAMRKDHNESAFAEVLNLIQAARHKAFQAVNTTLIDLYWHVGRVHQPQD